MSTENSRRSGSKQSQTTIDTVLKNIERSMLALSKKKDVESVASLGRLGRLHAQISSEDRKAKKDERKAASEVSRDAVIAYARLLAPEERGALVRDLQVIDSKRSGLA